MSIFNIKNAPAGVQSWFVTVYPPKGAPIMPTATMALAANAQLDIATGVYSRILVIVYSSAPGAPEAFLDAKEVNGQTLDGSSSYTFNWMAGKFS